MTTFCPGFFQRLIDRLGRFTILLFAAVVFSWALLGLGSTAPAFATGPLVTCSTSGTTLTVSFSSGSITSAASPAILAIDATGNITVTGCTSLSATVTAYTSGKVVSAATTPQWFELDSSLFASSSTLCTPSISLDSTLVSGSGFEESTPVSGSIILGDNGGSVVGSLDSICSATASDFTASTSVTNFQFNLGASGKTSSASVSLAGSTALSWTPVTGTSANFVESSTINSNTSVTGSSNVAASTLDLSSSAGSGTLLVNTTSTTPFAFKDTNSTFSPSDTPATSTPSVTFTDIKEVIGSSSLPNYFIANSSTSYNFVGTTTSATGSTLDLSSSSFNSSTATGGGVVGFSISGGVQVSSVNFSVYLIPAGLNLSFVTSTPGNFSIECILCTSSNFTTLDGSTLSGISVSFSSGFDAAFISFSGGSIVHFAGVSRVLGSASASNVVNLSGFVNGDSFLGSTVGDTLNLASLSTSSSNIATLDFSGCSTSGLCTLTDTSGQFLFDILATPVSGPSTHQMGVSNITGPSSGYTTFIIPNPISLSITAGGPSNTLDSSGGASGQSFTVESSNTASVSILFSNSLLSGVAETVSGIEAIKSSSFGSAIVTFVNSGNYSSFGNTVLTIIGSGGKNELDLSNLPVPSSQSSALTLINGAGTFSSTPISISISGFTVVNGPSTGSQYTVTFDTLVGTTCAVASASVNGCEYAFSSNISSTSSYFVVGSTIQSANPYIDFASGSNDCNFSSGTNYSEFCLAYGPASGVNQLLVATGFDNFSNSTPTSGGIGVKLPSAPSAVTSKTFTLSGSNNFIDGSAAPVQTTFTVSSPNLTVSFAAPTTTVFTFVGLTSFPIATLIGSQNGLTTFVLDPNLTRSINIVGQNCSTSSSCVNTISIASFPSLTTVNAASGVISLTSGHSYSFSGIQRFIGSTSGGTTFVGGTANHFGYIFVGQSSSSSSPANTLSYQSYTNGTDVGVRIDLLNGLACSASLSVCSASTSDQFSGISQIDGSTLNDTLVPGQSSFNVNGGGGFDTLDLSGAPIQGGATVDLGSGSVKYSINGLTITETVSGFAAVIDSNGGGDTITTSNQLASIDSTNGGNTYIAGGGDLIIGGRGSNTLDLRRLNATGVSIDLSDADPQLVAGHYYTINPGAVGTVYLPASSSNSSNYLHGGPTGTTTVYLTGGNNILFGGSGSFDVQVVSGGSFGTSIQVSGSGLTSVLTGTTGNDIYIPASGSLSSVTITPSSSGTSTLDFSGSPGSVYVDLSLTTTFQLPPGYISPSGFTAGATTSVGANSIQGGYGASISLNQSSNSQIGNVIGSNYSDIIVGSQGSNQITAGAGDSLIVGGGGADRLLATGGNTTFETGPGNNYVDGGAGNSTIDYSNGSFCPPATPGNTCSYGTVSVNLQSGSASRNAYTVNGQAGTDQIHNIRNIIGSSAACTQIPGTGSLCDVLEGGYLPGVIEMGYGPLPTSGTSNSALVSGLKSLLSGVGGGGGAICSSVGFTCFNATALIGGASGVPTVMIGGFGNGTTFQSNSSGDVILANSLGDTATVSSGGATFFVASSQSLGLFGSSPTPNNSALAIAILLAQNATLLESSNELSPSNDPQVTVAGL